MSETAMFLLGFLLVLLGADSLMRGAAGLAQGLGMKPASAGLLLVGFVVAIPPLAISGYALARGANELALGNAAGGALANLGLVLGGAALCAPLASSMRLLTPLAIVAVAAAALLFFFAYDGTLARWEGGVLLVAYVLALGFVLRHGREEAAPVQAELAELAETSTNVSQNLVRLLMAAAFLFFGSRWVVQGAPAVATLLGIDALATGLSIVAAGAALPALARAIVSALGSHANVVLALVLGGCLCNLLLLAGLVAIAQPLSFDPAPMRVVLPAVGVMAALLHLLLRKGARIWRREGVLLAVAFLAFAAVEIARA
jgi:cation:H+ antiporter